MPEPPEEPDPKTGPRQEKSRPFFLVRWLRDVCEFLLELWDLKWGKRVARNRCLAVAAASLGMFLVLGTGMFWAFATQGLYGLVEEFLEAATAGGWRLLGIADTVIVTMLMAVATVALSVIVGLGIFSSDERRTYLSYAWRGVLVLPSWASCSRCWGCSTGYPAANLLVCPDRTGVGAAERREFFARAAAGEWDSVMVTHDALIRPG